GQQAGRAASLPVVSRMRNDGEDDEEEDFNRWSGPGRGVGNHRRLDGRRLAFLAGHRACPGRGDRLGWDAPQPSPARQRGSREFCKQVKAAETIWRSYGITRKSFNTDPGELE